MERSDATGAIGLDEWLESVRVELERGGGAPVVTRDEQRALLDLTRIAAHRSERIAAPITAYLLGLALAPLDAEQRADEIRRVAKKLDIGEDPGRV